MSQLDQDRRPVAVGADLPLRRIVVVETNEVPLPLLRWFAERHPTSATARLLAQASVGETYVEESADRELYPSQTWATFATGVPYEKHHIYWYGDPKPSEFPLYWQYAAQHRSVGIVGTLHSSPLGRQGGQPGLRFALPDPFASDPEARPRSLMALQQFNLAMTKSNSRAVASRFPAADYLRGLAVLPGIGLRPATMTRLASLATGVATGRVPKERLRSGQFLLLADVFLRQLDEHDPDLAVLFTNHVASVMHRYWPATFPDDWATHPYDDDWIEQFADEIPYALRALDRFLGEIWELCRRTGRTLVVASSMGQEGGGPVDEGGSEALVVDDEHRFATELGISEPFEVLQAMAPHLSLRFPDVDTAATVAGRLDGTQLDDRPLVVHRADDTVTLTYHLGTDADSISVNGVERDPGSMGFRRVAVSEHKAGRHMPLGALIWADPDGRTDRLPDHPVDLTEVAPAMLGALGLPPLDHHRPTSIATD